MNTRTYKFHRKCSECEEKFSTNRETKKTCSTKCTEERNRRKTRERAKKFSSNKGICPVCKNEFETSYKFRKYCSIECKKVKDEDYYGNRYAKDKYKTDLKYLKNFKPYVLPETNVDCKEKIVLRDCFTPEERIAISVTSIGLGRKPTQKYTKYIRADGRKLGSNCMTMSLDDISDIIEIYNARLANGFNQQYVNARRTWIKRWKKLERFINDKQ